jgi:hypothetical protein
VNVTIQRREPPRPGDWTKLTFYHVREIFEMHGIITVKTPAGCVFAFRAKQYTWCAWGEVRVLH